MRRSQSWLLVVLIGLVSACARQTTGQGTPPQARVEQSPEEALRARATQFWEARVKGDSATQYDLLEPKARERVTLTGYARARSGVVFLSYTLQAVEVAGAEGTVTAETIFRLNLPQVSRFGPWTQTAITRWVRVDGLWYLRYDESGASRSGLRIVGPEAAERFCLTTHDKARIRMEISTAQS